jgi:transglutaminase-like putative cysteine protease
MAVDVGCRSGDEDRYLLEQRFRYVYAHPVVRLRHRLMVVPRAAHGGQYRLGHGITVSGALASVSETTDSFGNHVTELGAPSVSEWIEFTAWALLERRGGGGVTTLSPDTDGAVRLLAPTPLTRADAALTEAARRLSGSASDAMDLAERVCAWTHGALAYRHGVTDVQTPAATALAGGAGVCQDYAHVMVAVCRAAGLPARYVSGHLLGEGGSHAWVEVVMSDPSDPAAGQTVAVAFDPTHGRRAARGYFTVAVGRDYADVAPTSGTFEGTGPGVLSSGKRLMPAEPGRPAAS